MLGVFVRSPQNNCTHPCYSGRFASLSPVPSSNCLASARSGGYQISANDRSESTRGGRFRCKRVTLRWLPGRNAAPAMRSLKLSHCSREALQLAGLDQTGCKGTRVERRMVLAGRMTARARTNIGAWFEARPKSVGLGLGADML